MLELYLVGLAVPITLAILFTVFWTLVKSLKEYTTREVNGKVEELKIEFRTFAKDVNTSMQTSFGKVAEDVHAMSEMQQRLTQIAISHDTLIKELKKKG